MLERPLAALAIAGVLVAAVACQPRPESAAPSPAAAPADAAGDPTPAPAPASDAARAPTDDAANAPPGKTNTATIDELLALIDAPDGPGLARALEPLLLAGEAGRATLVDLAIRCDGDQVRRRTLTLHPSVTFGIASLAHRHPRESIAVAVELLAKFPADASSQLWAYTLGYLPTMLEFHGDGAAEPRERLSATVLAALPAARGQTLNLLFAAASRLGLEPNAGMLISLLEADQDFVNQRAIVQHLIARGRPGVQALVDWLDGLSSFESQSPRATIELLGKCDDAVARQCIQRFITHENLGAREAGVRAYFQRPRGDEGVPVALDFLNSSIPLRRKRFFLNALRRQAPAVLEALRATPEAIFRPDVRALVDATRPAPQQRTPAP